MSALIDEPTTAAAPESAAPLEQRRRLARRPGARLGQGRPSTVQTVITVVLTAFLAWQVVVPLLALVYASLKDVRPDDPSFLSPTFTLQNFIEAFDSRMVEVTLTTLVFGLASSVLAIVLGGFLAFAITRTNAWLRGLMAGLVIAQLAFPSVIYPVAWQYLLSERMGVFNTWWDDATGAGPLTDVNSLPGMVLVQAFEMLPMVYLFLVPAISAMNRALEEAAEMAGASRTRALLDIGLRLSAPALVATLLVAMMRAWDSFAVPWTLGSTQGIFTFSTELFRRTTTPPSDTGLISAFATPMVVLSVIMVFYYQRFNRAASRYAVMTGKNYRSEPIVLGPVGRVVVAVVGLAIGTVAILLPTAILVWISSSHRPSRRWTRSPSPPTRRPSPPTRWSGGSPTAS